LNIVPCKALTCSTGQLLAKQWGVEVFPTTVLIAPNGQARWRVLGEVDWAGPEAAKWTAT
jgi:protein-disulfide isomerase-like protein with CxxC motif